MRLALLRHGPTEWNAQGLAQGRTDVPLSAAGRELVRRWRLPDALNGFSAVASPLIRARETAEILLGGPVATDPRLMEMDWGEWEGRTLGALRSELGDLRAAWQAEGLDFRAPGGESQREVQSRLAAFLADCLQAPADTVAVCHHGVIRAVYGLATGWDMRSDWPDRIQDGCAHIFAVGPDASLRIEALNIPLAQTA